MIAERISAKGRTKKWLKIIKVGNDDFREVYETVWRKTILASEQEGIKEYKRSVAKLQATLPQRNPKQSQKELLPLYQQAARIKPAYDDTIRELAARFKKETGLALDLQICPTLKKVSRIVEKSLLKSKVEGEVANVKDIIRWVFDGCAREHRNMHVDMLIDDCVVFLIQATHITCAHRSMATVRLMSHVAVVIEILLKMQEEGLLTLLRLKERFLSQPSAGGECPLSSLFENITPTNVHSPTLFGSHFGIAYTVLGWRDIMVNLRIAGENPHICEVQVSARLCIRLRVYLR